MKQIKVYNVIFPIWFLLFFPPVILITLVGNFIIDSLVILICFYAFKLVSIQSLKEFYKRNILKVWGFGFLADIIGAAILLLTNAAEDFLGLPNEIISAISYDLYSHPVAVMIVIFSMLVAGFFIFIFNYKITFKNLSCDNKIKFKLALTIAIITTPWTFLISTRWLY